MASDSDEEISLISEVDRLQWLLKKANEPVDPAISTHIMNQIISVSDSSHRVNKWRKRVRTLQMMVDNLPGGVPVPAPNVAAALDSTRATLEQHHGGAAAPVKLEDAGGAAMLKRRRFVEREDVDSDDCKPKKQRVSIEAQEDVDSEAGACDP